MSGQDASIIGTKPSNYAGDVTVEEAFRLLGASSNSLLIDVRTMAEWSFVGRPNLDAINKPVAFIEWQSFPAMDRNENFVADVRSVLSKEGLDEGEISLFMICRSGARSRAAAIAVTEAGLGTAYNVAGGFEGDLDPDNHRGNVNGWKASGLIWSQT
ncbi:MAG: rhodanese-like domain-containing protein [Parvibaculum sp.]